MLNIRLRELRTEKKITQADVANYLKVSHQAYNFYETGKREPDYNTLQKLATFFKVSTDYLLGRSDQRQNQNDNITTAENEWPPGAKVLFRDVKKLTPEQFELVQKLVKEFVNED